VANRLRLLFYNGTSWTFEAWAVQGLIEELMIRGSTVMIERDAYQYLDGGEAAMLTISKAMDERLPAVELDKRQSVAVLACIRDVDQETARRELKGEEQQ
jgi:hypothetical protein